MAIVFDEKGKMSIFLRREWIINLHSIYRDLFVITCMKFHITFYNLHREKNCQLS